MSGLNTLRRRLLPILACLPLGLCGLFWPLSATGQETAADKALLDMRNAYQKGQRSQLTQLLPKVKGHTLEPLAAYWEIQARLDTASPADIRTFLQRYAGSYYEDRLRNDWLLQLGHQGDWETFNRELPLYRMKDDREVQCYALLSDFRRQGTDVAAQVSERWLAQKEADEGCSTAAKALFLAGKLPAETVWQRARWGAENNRSRVAIQAVEMLDPDWAAILKTLLASPEQYLAHKLTAIRHRTKELVTLALVRLAATDPEAAADHADRLRWKSQLTAEERSWVWGVIGKYTALRLSNDAATYFNHARDEHLPADLLTWKVRAALRAGQWGMVRNAIAAMPPALQQEPTWSYWQARALERLGTPQALEQSQTLLRRVAGSSGFYEQLALEALGQAVTVPPAPATLTPAEKIAAKNNPGLQRALRAIELGLRTEGVREWNYEAFLHQPGGMDERSLLAAADLACQLHVWDRCINTSVRTRGEIDQAQRFPMPYKDTVVQRTRDIGLDPAYVYGLIRQESRFIMDARSGVGASGLMQVMPATARWTARQIGLTGFKPDHITDRDTNIAIGTAYLKLALDDFEGSMALAAAAYNAGPNRPRTWRNGPLLEAAIWIENIPFNETRDYVKRVLSNTVNYAAILTGQPQKLSSRLHPIGPRSATAQVPNLDLP